MLLAYLLRETGLGSALTQTRSLQRSRSDPISPKRRGQHEPSPTSSTRGAAHAAHQKNWVSVLPSPLWDEHGAEVIGGSAVLSPRAVTSPHSSHGATPWDCSQKNQHPNTRLHRFETIPVSGKHRLTLEGDDCFQPKPGEGY